MKVKIRQILSFVLICALAFGSFAIRGIVANAASSGTVSLSGKEAFCLTLGATCHAGNKYDEYSLCAIERMWCEWCRAWNRAYKV